MKTMKTRCMLVLLLAVSTAVWAAPGDERFLGGSYDGWDRDAMTASAGLGGALVSLASATDQTFTWNEANPALAMLTIEAEDPAGTITNGGAMRVTVPAAWACRFDTSVSVTYGGDAAGKVNPATFSDGGRTLNIPVTADFTAGDTLTLSGLKLQDLALCSAGIQRLELDFTGNGSRDVYDGNTLALTVPWPGGSYDGWDQYALAESASLDATRRGTVFMLSRLMQKGR